MSPRTYKSRGIAWSDPDARRAYNREAQRRWRALHSPRKSPVSPEPKGVTRIKSTGKYVARLVINGAQFHLGTYNTSHEAKQVYETAKAKLHETTAAYLAQVLV